MVPEEMCKFQFLNSDTNANIVMNSYYTNVLLVFESTNVNINKNHTYG